MQQSARCKIVFYITIKFACIDNYIKQYIKHAMKSRVSIVIIVQPYKLNMYTGCLSMKYSFVLQFLSVSTLYNSVKFMILQFFALNHYAMRHSSCDCANGQ